MELKALGILEPPSLNRRVYPGEKIDLPDEEAVRYLSNGLAVAVAQKPSQRAEKRPKPEPETR